jgi:electron transfer flavoprotein alpha/beta subunit
MVPAALAHHLRAPLFARVADVQLPETGDEVLRLTVRSGGRLCRVASPLPAVLAIPVADGPPTKSRNLSPAVKTLTLAQLAIDASQLVPRPNLLGTFTSIPAESVQRTSLDEAAQILLRGH